MNPVAILAAVVSGVLSVGSMILLFNSINGACSPVTNLLACAGFMVFTVATAAAAKKGMGDKFPQK